MLGSSVPGSQVGARRRADRLRSLPFAALPAAHKGLKALAMRRPDQDLLQLALFDPRTLAELGLDGDEQEATRHQLRGYQRLGRVGVTPEQADTLFAAGLSSAHHIASIPRAAFINDFAARLGSTADAAEVHDLARSTQARVTHTWARLRDQLAPHSRNNRYLRPSDELLASVTDIPSYTDLFGTLDYMAVPECQSVLGPSAYFVDLMRVIEDSIVAENGGIQDIYKLKTRRPDLYTIDLTCANTQTPVPKIDIINDVIATRLTSSLGNDTDYAIATRVFPFFLPTNLHLTALRSTLGVDGQSLTTIYQEFQARAPDLDEMPQPLNLASEQLGLSAEQRAIVSTATIDAGTLGLYYGAPTTTTSPSPVALASALGTVSVVAEATTVTGTGFVAALVGQVIQAAGVLRVINTVDSATQLTVDCAWPASASNVAATAFPPQSVVQLSVFSRVTGLPNADVYSLFQQNLTPKEIAASLGSNFFINAGNAAGVVIGITSDMTDSNYSLDVIDNLSLDNLDRSNRFLRLAAASGWSHADLDWAIRSAGFNTLDDSTLLYLGKLSALMTRLALPVEEACGLYAPLKTYGRGNEVSPRDLFDRVFNTTRIQTDLKPYRPTYAPNPLFDSTPISWVVDADDSDNHRIQAWLAGSLQLSEADLRLLANRIGGPSPILLDVPKLSRFYAYAKLARALKLKMAALFQAIDLLGDGDPDSLDEVIALVAFKDAADQAGLTLDDVGYIIGGPVLGKLAGTVDPASVPAFLDALRTLGKSWLLNEQSFVFDNIDAAKSKTLYEAFVAGGAIDARGVVLLESAPPFSLSAPLFPVTALALHVPPLTLADAQQAWTDLNTHGALNGDVITAPVTIETDLSYLFDSDPSRKAKVDAVQDVLVVTSNDIVHTGNVLGDALDEQELGAYTQLSLLLQDEVLLTEAVAGLTLGEIGCPLQLLLTEQGDRAAVTQAIVCADRLAYAAFRLNINATDMGIACHVPDAFGFVDLAEPNLKDLYLLAMYARLIKAFSTTGFLIASYLMAPTQPLYVKMHSLEQVTGWPVAQSTALVTALWGDTLGYDNLHGLDVMRVCFQRATGFGVDMPSLLALAHSAGYPRMPLPTLTGGDALAWSEWAKLALAALDILKAKFGDAAWQEMSKPVHDKVAEQRRRALVALAVLLLAPTVDMVDSARTLSEYLLLDVEAGSVNITTPILESTLAAQMYLQRCRMALEPGVTRAEISELTWSWLSNYRLWEANRKVFIYPESYIDPTLRRPRTPLFDTMMEQLQQGEITDASVTNAFTQYLNGFDELAKLQNVDSVFCSAPDPDTGEVVDQLVMLGRTAGEPYGYYLRTLEDGVVWSAWRKIDAKIPVSTVTPVFAFGRLFLFWVETEEASTSVITTGTQSSVNSVKASIRYSFQRVDKTWTSPQPVLSGIVFDVDPSDYYTSTIDPRTSTPPEGIDITEPYWYRPYVVVVPGASGMPDQLVVAMGNAYKAIGTSGGPVTKPPTSDPVPDRVQFNQSVYNASVLGNTVPTGTTGSVQLLPVAVIDDSLDITEAWAFMSDYTAGPQPFGATSHNRTFLLIPSQNVLVDNMLSEGADYYTRVYAGGVTTTCLYSLAPQAEVTPVSNLPGWWLFNNGDEAFLAVTTDVTFNKISDIVSMTPDALLIGQGVNEVSLACGAYTSDSINVQEAVVQFTRLTTGAVGRMNRTLFAGGIEALLSNATQVAPGPGSLCFTRFYTTTPVIAATCDPDANNPPPPPNTIPPDVLCGGQVDFLGAYRPYFEEIFFQAPFLLASMLNANQRFAEAQRWYDFIFDPTAAVTPSNASEPAVFWQYEPFRQDTSLPSLAEELSDNTAILRWNKHPFDPFSVAALRPSAYKKTIVMHYIDNLLDWGDQQFALDTRESLNQALLLYLMSYDLLGPRPHQRGEMPMPEPINFQDILDTYGDDIPQFLIDLENALPATAPLFQYNPAPFNLLDSYFGVGENADFMAYWTRVEDRLFKLRNGMNLNGVVRQLPFFQPPIDPNAVVSAIGKGAQLPSVVEYSPAASPNYRFKTMLDRAKSVTQTLIGFGSSLLAALEKKDAESLGLLRSVQERAVLKLTTQLKDQQVVDAEETLNSLLTSMESATYRRGYYAALHDDGLSPAEEVSIAMMALANVFQTQSGVMRAMSSASHLIPNVGSPFAMTYGGIQVGFAFDAASAIFDTISRNFDFASSLSSVLAGYQRRDQEWVMQQQLATYEVTQLQSQIAGAQARVSMAQQEVLINELQLNQADETQRVLLEKFTNEELYSWMSVRLSVIYFQTYKLAFDMAMSAQRAYQYEMNSASTFIDFGYWDSGRKGLLAGEGLLLSLSQMENNFLAGNSLRLNITKTLSLREMNPHALLMLQNKGVCDFDLSELLFDMDYPGHYCRKIESVSVTLPSVLGPYQNLHGVLTQKGNTVVLAPSPDAVAFLLGQDPSNSVDGLLRLNWRTNQQIALSRGVDDNGMAGVDGSDDRYVPFEGTGAVSQWRLELPQRNNAFDLGSVSDVIIQLTYSAISGGEGFSKDVRDMLPTDYAGARMLELSQYSGAWYAFMNPAADDTSQTLSFRVPRSLFPYNVTGDIALSGAYLQLVVDHTTFVGPMPVTLTVPGVVTPIDLTFAKDNNSTSTVLSATLDSALAWTLQIERSDIPAELKLGDRIDPARLVGIYLLLTFDGTIS